MTSELYGGQLFNAYQQAVSHRDDERTLKLGTDYLNYAEDQLKNCELAEDDGAVIDIRTSAHSIWSQHAVYDGRGSMQEQDKRATMGQRGYKVWSQALKLLNN